MEPPPELSSELQAIIREYARTTTPFADMPLPAVDRYVEVLLGTGDTATGSDGAPHALLRMAPRTVAQMLHQLLLQILTDPDQVREPMPLLAWIPKGTAGLSADNWRPLGMPEGLFASTSSSAISACGYTQPQFTTSCPGPAQ